MRDHRDAVDEPALRRYVVGLSDERQRAELEERLFVSDDLFEQLQAIEAEIAHEYVDRELPAAEIRSFERQLEVNGRLREQVAIARSLAVAGGSMSGASTAANAGPSSVPKWLPIAAGFVAAVAGILLVLSLRGDRPQVAQNRPERAPSRVATPAPGGRSPQPAEPPAPPAPETAISPPTPASTVVAVVTLSGATFRSARAATDVPLPTREGALELRLLIETGDEYPSYDAQLSTGGAVAWTGRSLSLRKTTDGPMVPILVPTKTLAAGRYEVILTGRPAEGRPQELAAYRFQIIP